MICQVCGKEIPDGSKFCPICGTTIQAEAQQQPEGDNYQQNQQQYTQQQYGQQQYPQQQYGQQQYGQQQIKKFATFEFHDPAVDCNGPVNCDFMLSLKRYIAHFADFNGRASKSEYWYFFLWSLILGCASFIPVLGYLLGIAMIVPSLALAVRRLHDIGKSGLYYLMILIPLAGPFILLYYFLKDSDGPNQWS